MKLPSNSWPALVKTHTGYRRMPVWGSMRRIPDTKGRLRRQDVAAIAQRGGKAALRVQKAIDKFTTHCGSEWPKSPRSLIDDQSLFDKLRHRARPGDQILRNFFDALIFERDYYTCHYCGRDAFTLFTKNRKHRTLWLVVDHRNAESKQKGVYEFDNSIISCWSCNTLKGPLPEAAFFSELDSLVDARLAHRKP